MTDRKTASVQGEVGRGTCPTCGVAVRVVGSDEGTMHYEPVTSASDKRQVMKDGEDWDDDREWPCTHCGGEGVCWDGSDPLGNCPDEPHRCHACGGSGNREDQVIF